MFKNLKFKILGVGLAFVFLLSLSTSFLIGCKFNDNFITKFSKNVNEYNLNINVDCENKKLNVNQTTKFVNQTEDVKLDSVYFHIFPKAFSDGVVNKPVSSLNEKKAYPNGVNYGEVEINKVCLNNEEVNFSFLNDDKDILVVNLKEDLMPKKSVNISFDYELKLPNIYHRYGYGEDTINLGNFYLIACVYDENEGYFANSYHYNGDPFYSELANYKVSCSYNKNYVLATSGYVVNEKIENETKIALIEGKAIRDFAMILSNKFNCLSENYNGIQVNYFYYNDKTPEKSLKTSVDSLKTFINLFGEYPYKQLSVCESNFVYGGMEYPNLVYISDNLDNYEDFTYTIVHEIAHQWWYNMVGNNQFKYGFLDEGITEFSTYLFFDENLNYNMDTKEMIKNTTNSYLLFLDVYKEVFNSIDTSMLRSLNEYNTEPEYIYMSYVKGVLMYDNLKEILGKTKLIKCLKTYFNENKGSNAVPSDLISAFNKASGKNLENYFNSWLNGSVVIENM